MSRIELIVEEDDSKLNVCVSTKFCKRVVSFLLAGVFTILGIVGFKVEIKVMRDEGVTNDLVP